MFYTKFNIYLPVIFILALFSLIGTSAQAISAEKEIQFTGIAKNRHGDQLYKEIHHDYYVEGQLNHSKTEFFDNDGKLIAEITSDFSQALNCPNYHLINYRSDEEEICNLKGDQIEIKYRPHNKKEFTTKTFPKKRTYGIWIWSK